jgi:hypothetical protein
MVLVLRRRAEIIALCQAGRRPNCHGQNSRRHFPRYRSPPPHSLCPSPWTRYTNLLRVRYYIVLHLQIVQ